MPTYALEIEAFGIYTTNIPSLEIWGDGILNSTYSISSSGSTISVNINYGGSLPTSLTLTFNDAFGEIGRTIEIRSVKINDKYVNVGNYLSSNSIVKGASATVAVASNPFLFDETDPLQSEFTVGSTRTLTAINDTLRITTSVVNEVFDALAGRDVIYLGSGNDKVFGNDGNDIIYGYGGNDLLSGGNGDDRLYGGEGNDRLYGGEGDDILHGEDGDDIIYGGNGNDNLVGHAGADILLGGDGDDKLNGGDDNDYLFGGNDNDSLVGGAGNDTLDGGNGDDLAYGGDGNDIINGGDGNDILVGDNGDDTINGDDGDDVIYGLNDNDTLYGGANNDYLDGGNGNDTLYGDTGNDVLIGGAGSDTLYGGDNDDILHGNGINQQTIYTLLKANPGIVFNAETNSFYQYVNTAANFATSLANAQATTLGGISGHLVTITSASENTFIRSIITSNIWLSATDIASEGMWIWNGGAEDGLNFWNGAAGGSAATGQYNSWGGGEPNDYGAGEDTTEMRTDGVWNDNNGNLGYVIEWDAGLMLDDNAADILNGGAGKDFLYGYGGNDVLNGDADDDVLMGGDGNDTLNGGTGNDSLYGGTGNDILTGGTGADILVGGAGVDTIDGGNDNDIIYLSNGDFVTGESITGGAGTDNLIFTNATTVDFSTGTLATLENIVGSVGNDVVTITLAQLIALTTFDLLAGTDTISTKVIGTLNITASTIPSLANVEIGNIIGSTGNDTLTLTGAQLDTFIIGSGIINFDAGTDVLNITSTSADLNTLGSGSNAYIQGLETISASTAAAGVTINMSAQTETLTITGSSSADIITGGTGADIIDGGNGNDTINLANGYFAAGESIIGGSGTDTLVLINATTVNFTTGTLNTIEILNGSTGNDIVTMSGTQLNSFTTLSFSGGTDVLNITSTSTGLNALADGSVTGLETVSASTAAAGVTITLTAQSEAFTVTGSDFNDTITGGTGNDIITGGAGNDTLNGGNGNDIITGGTGNDTLNGGAGTDTAIYSLAWNYYTISLVGSTYTLIHKNGGADGTDTATQIENFQFADGTFTTANLLAPVITSNGGGATATVSRAENGTSVTTVTATNPNPGGAALSYSISGGSDAARFTINSSTGVLAFASAPDYERPLDSNGNNIYNVQVSASDGTHADIQNIAVTVTNVNEADVGNTIGTAGTITVGGSVLYTVDSNGDRDWFGVSLTGGVTYAIWARGAPTEAASSTDPRIYGIRNAANTVVDAGDDDGGVGYESLLYFTPGSTGTYYIDAGAYGSVTGQILLSVFTGGSTQNGGAGADTLNGSANADYLIGNNGNDILYGNAGSDILEGGNNDDILYGGLGADVLIGGAGADTFVFTSTDASDSIIDFTSGQNDVLDISNILVGWNAGTDDIDDYLQFQTVGGDTIVRVDVDGLANGTNYIEIAVLEGTTGLNVQTLYDNSQIIA